MLLFLKRLFERKCITILPSKIVLTDFWNKCGGNGYYLYPLLTRKIKPLFSPVQLESIETFFISWSRGCFETTSNVTLFFTFCILYCTMALKRCILCQSKTSCKKKIIYFFPPRDYFLLCQHCTCACTFLCSILSLVKMTPHIPTMLSQISPHLGAVFMES